jgi:MSHA biogenesis protein MshO
MRAYPLGRASAGFTLVELILVVVLTGALATFATDLLVQPFTLSEAVSRRAGLADRADQALSRMTREIRAALPNSLRVSGDARALQLMTTVAGGRYRAAPAADGSGDPLRLDTADDGFDVIGGLSAPPSPGSWVVVYNVAAEGPVANAWAGDNRAVIAPGSDAGHIVLAPAHRFPLPSPARRFQVADDVVTYVCDGGGILRWQGTTPTAALTVPPDTGTGSLLVDGVAACRFAYDPGAGTRNGLVTLRLTLAEAGETASLLRMVHVENLP